MLRPVGGVPGTGKTYYAFHMFLNEFYDWNKEHDRWELKRDKNGEPVKVQLFTNIDGLKIDHINIDHYFIEQDITHFQFFTNEFFKKYTEEFGGRVVVILDEANRYFPKDFKESKSLVPGTPEYFWKSNLFFFEYHRHWSLDIYLVCPNLDRLCKEVRALAEYEVHSIKKAFTIGSEFKYHYMNDSTKSGKPLKTKAIKPNQMIFCHYKSFDGKEVTHDVRPLRKMLAVSAFSLILLGVAFKVFVSMMTPAEASTTETSLKQPDQVSPHIADQGRTATPVQQQSKVQRAQGERPARDVAPAIAADFIMVKLGGMWVGDMVAAVDFFGRIVPTRDFPYAITPIPEEKKVLAFIPPDVLSTVRPGLWVDSTGVTSKTRQVNIEPDYQVKQLQDQETFSWSAGEGG